MAERLDGQRRTSMEVSVFCPSALTQIQSWSGLGLSNPVEKYVDQLGIIIPTKSPTMDRKGRRNSAAGQTCSRKSESLWRLSFMLYEQWLGNRQRIIRWLSQAISSAVRAICRWLRCWKMLKTHHPHHPQALSRYWFLMIGSWSSTCWCLGDSVGCTLMS